MLSIRIYQFTIIIIKLLHDSKLPITNTNNNDWNWQSTTGNNEVNSLLSVMNLTISKNKQYHVLIVMFLELFAFCDGLFQQLCEVCWSTEIKTLEYISVLLDYLFASIKIGVVHSSVDGETVVNLLICVKIRMWDSSPKTIDRHKFIIVIVQKNVRNLP